MNPSEKLDIILRYLSENKGHDSEVTLIKGVLRNKYKADLEQSEIILILNKLIKDEYVIITNKSFMGTETKKEFYKITFDGDFIIESGGYSQEMFKEGILMRKAKRNEWMISRGAAFAAIFSGCIVLIELVKLLISHPHLFCSHK